MGVFRLSSRLIQAKVGVVADITIGDLTSDGYVADNGVFSDDGRGAAAGFESVVEAMLVLLAVS